MILLKLVQKRKSQFTLEKNVNKIFFDAVFDTTFPTSTNTTLLQIHLEVHHHSYPSYGCQGFQIDSICFFTIRASSTIANIIITTYNPIIQLGGEMTYIMLLIEK